MLSNDTNSGKTWLCCELIRRAVKDDFSLVPYKPVATGDRADALRLAEASSRKLAWTEITPVLYQAPLAPLAAAILEDNPLDWTLLDDKLGTLEANYHNVLIESAGGVLSPMDRDHTMCDLALRWKASTLLVVPNRLGSITQCRTALEALLSRGLEVLAVVLNEFPSAVEASTNDELMLEITRSTNRALLEEYYPQIEFFSSQAEDLSRLWSRVKNHLNVMNTQPANA